MKPSYLKVSGFLAGMLATAAVFAQSPTPPETPAAQPSDPSAASSPHQRAATKSPSGETAAPTGGASPSDSATPHQKQTVKKKHKKKPQTDAPSSQS
jgi:hypothetical protein